MHGRLGRDPEVKTTQTGKVFARLSVAVDRGGRDKGADFVSCVAWDKTAEFIGKYWNKGKEILCEGRIQTGSYQAQDGTKRYTTDVVLDRVEFCGSKGDGPKPQTDVQDEIPF